MTHPPEPGYEAVLERTIIRLYRSKGWIAFHIHPDGRAIPKGWPDIIALGPEGRVVFIECKVPGRGLDPIQDHAIMQLRRLGHTVLVATTLEEAIGPLLEEQQQ